MPMLALFDTEFIRKEWHENERWFSIVDIVAYLTNSDRPRKYRSDLKSKMSRYEGFVEVSAKIGQLKFVASDGKKYLGDAVNTETALRVIQSIPSPKAEPLKRRLAELGNQRFEEYEDPELGIQRANDRAILKYKSMVLLTTVSEEASKEIILQKDMKGFNDLQTAVKQGANVAKKTKEELESYTGKEVVSSENRLSIKQKKVRKLILGDTKGQKSKNKA